MKKSKLSKRVRTAAANYGGHVVVAGSKHAREAELNDVVASKLTTLALSYPSIALAGWHGLPYLVVQRTTTRTAGR